MGSAFPIREKRGKVLEMAQLYMVMGGIPHYLKEIQPGKTAIQNIDEICFSNTRLYSK